MTSERPVARLRLTPLLAAGAVMQLAAIVLYAVNSAHQRFSPAWGWLPGIALTLVTVVACWQTARTPGLDRVAARLWRSIGATAFFVALGNIGDARQSVLDPARATQQQHDTPTAICYAIAIGLVIWTLMRLPLDRRGTTARFLLDALTITVTVGVFAWYFTTRAITSGSSQHTTVPTLMLAVLGLIVALAMIKVAMSGTGGLEQGVLRWFAGAAAIGTVGGGLFPLFVEVPPGLSGSQIFAPATMLCLAFAADRQRRAVGGPVRPPRRRSVSSIPYVAVAATDGLLLWVSGESGRTVLVVAAAASLLTAIVAVRQFTALRDNGRLLRRVDQQLTQLNDYQAELQHRATHDGLTGLANRALFEQSANEMLDAGVPLCLAMVDLDDFKTINDRLGHAVGDAFLAAIADRLRTTLRTSDIPARLGGDEFGILLPGLTGDEALALLSRIDEAMSVPLKVAGHQLLARASTGLAEAWPGATAAELLRRADIAMYYAKDNGKAQFAVYDAALERTHEADQKLGAELRHAFDAGQFTLAYQPIVRLPDGLWTGLETLIRWPHPERGFIGPDLFIPIAERTGLIVPLGTWILHTALGQMAAWDAEFGPGVAPRELGVNVSARQLREPGFAGEVREALSFSGVSPDRLVVEVTETAVFDGGVALDTLLEIVKLGVKVALDDFGTGHSSLGLLRTVPANTLKVDKSFVAGIGGASEEAVIATAMIQITDGLHLKAVAEGVETEAQADTLYQLGYRFAQGYHFSRPLPPAEVRSRLTDGELARSTVVRN
ncbi:putative bifunctional diguanylate cyclase/phosphodiesterase [Paractinoplanes lichenicola]|uniref:Bifunctional diguanylate cyclase/phosphodiesterase n=1 Tax=Paractinoplanes lichenicola TaxID=2802976 RepID=A0ABS1VID1_9ACTN|nr:bifunctional diguanylate cyclase/phosphodiesterase [Actinoplanes lichenicola]MBL7254419.1 bifunctional diguanylate cyclase/phosphodiesterase [Actinoplanes lichenicola]